MTSAPILKVSAQRQISENKWRRVYKEFPIPPDCDTSDLTAKFESGTLKIKFPKLITSNGNNANNNDNNKPQETPTPPERDAVDDKNNAAREKEDQAKANKTHDDDKAVSENNQKEKEPPSDDSTKKKEEVAQKDQEKAKTYGNEVSGKTSQSVQEEKEPALAATDDFKKEKGKATVAAAGEVKERAKNIARRSKTRVLDFTLSLRPSADDQSYKEALSGLVTGLKKMKTLMNIILVASLVVVLVLYVKNAFRSLLSNGGSQVHEL